MMNRSVLLIDDEPIILDSVSDDLKDEGYKVITARTGEEGIRKFRENPCDLVITDLVMDGINGFELTREIKKINLETGVIVLTGYGTTRSAIEAFRSGANDLLLKPLQREELFERVALCLEEKDARRKISIAEKSLTVCRCCQKIKDPDATESGKGAWMEIGAFLSQKARVEISYAVCPECENNKEEKC